jgi:HEAT repeat protein
MLRFDKENVVLKSLTFIKTQDECIYQLLHDDQIWARLDAIEQLKVNTIDTSSTIQALCNCLYYDSYWSVREKAAATLDMFPGEKPKIALIAGCSDENSGVRSTCIRTLSNYDDPSLFPVFKKLASSDSSYFVQHDALNAMIHYPDSLNFEYLVHFVNQESFNDMVSTAAFECLRELKDKRALPIAQAYAADSLAFFFRRYSALRLIEEIGIGDPVVEQLLIELLYDHDEKIRRKVIQILSNFTSSKTLNALKEYDKQELSDGVRRRLHYAIEKIENNGLDDFPLNHE